jgi:hypothetical protein
LDGEQLVLHVRWAPEGNRTELHRSPYILNAALADGRRRVAPRYRGTFVMSVCNTEGETVPVGYNTHILEVFENHLTTLITNPR